MASDINKVILIGRLTKDPELKYTPSGTAVTNFSLANNKTYSQNGEKKETVSFFNCIAWGKLGSDVIAVYSKKGQRVAIEGRLQQRTWEDKEGRKQYAVEVVVDGFQILDSKKDESYQKNDTKESQPEIPNFDDVPESSPFSDDDLPF